MYHTIGQRKGLGIGGSSAAENNGEAWYAAAKDLANNILIVVQGHEHPALLSKSLIAEGCDWVSGEFPTVGKTYTAKTRYRQQDQFCELCAIDGDQIMVNFSQPQRAVTPGQALVLYDENSCLGGATIVSSST